MTSREDPRHTTAIHFVDLCPICEDGDGHPMVITNSFIGRREFGGVTMHVTQDAVHLHDIALIDRRTWTTRGLLRELLTRLVRNTLLGFLLGVAPDRTYHFAEDGTYTEETR